MSQLWKFVAVTLILAATALSLPSRPALAQSSTEKFADPASAQVEGFYDVLLAAMKSGGTAKSRYEKLKPAVEKAFDLPAMTAIANYAKNFDSYGGEKFTVEPASIARGSDHFVKSSLKTRSEAIAFNYRIHRVGLDWKITDVYLAGNISQMSQKRSDFAGTLASGGPQGLAKRINTLTDQMLD
jgi:phospholipid transport system substrate-binding protein